MSFRNRLTLFFIVIVIVPMIAVALVLFRLVSDSEAGKRDARLGEAQTSASGLFREAESQAQQAGTRIARDPVLGDAIRGRDRSDIEQRLRVVARREEADRVRLTLEGIGRFAVGSGPAVSPANIRAIDADGQRVGQLRVSTTSATDYAEVTARVTGLDVVVTGAAGLLASTIPGLGSTTLPLRGEATAAGQDYRVTGFEGAGFDAPVTVRVLSDERTTASKVTGRQIVVAAALIGFLVLALAFALAVSRSLQAQIQRLLVAAQQLGKGDFAIRVPTDGSDEFALLGREFNSMAGQLEGRLEELQTERQRLRDAIRRVGESTAKGLDRDALLEIVVETAVDGIGADCGRAVVRDHPDRPPRQVASAGDLSARRSAIRAVEAAALQAGRAAETTVDGASALAQPLQASEGDHVLGLISVARAERPFTANERELFNYLAGQAAVSIENVDLHETVQRQAVTDELTGLFNHRRFQEVMATEVERTKRFGQDMGLIMLDIDDFKRVNDVHGHMQGDLVLREVAKVLKQSSREIDEPARYGGEEMAVALPQTDLEGAFQFAERVRRRIEALELPVIDGHGVIRVTASFGAAALPTSAETDKDALVAAADAALYRAKRAGKNRTVKAE